MGTPINRAPFNALADDDGSNTTGSPWNKAAIDGVLLTPIDAARAWTQAGFTSAGAPLHNWDPGIVGDTIIALNVTGACDLTGFVPVAAPYIGQTLQLILMNTGTVTLYHDNAASTDGFRLRLQNAGFTMSGVWAGAVLKYFAAFGHVGWFLVSYHNGHGVAVEFGAPLAPTP